MEMVHASEPAELDQLVNSLFEAAGFGGRDQLSQKDFIMLMKDYQGELSEAALQFTGKLMPVPTARGCRV